MVTTRSDRSDRIKAGPPAQTRRAVVEIVESDIEIITPVFGGGVTARGTQRRPDEVTPVRGTTVRGQLRFWWRALYGARYQTVAELREAEGRLWGLASEPGWAVVNVDASKLKPPAPHPIFRVVVAPNGRRRCQAIDNDIGYAGFPLQPSDMEMRQNAEPAPAYVFDGTFLVRVTLSSVADSATRDEVTQTLRCWRCFGGIGGRTRRGFGALSAPAGATADQLLSPAGARVAGVPLLAGAKVVLGARSNSALIAWPQALHALRQFRQGPTVGRNPGNEPNHPGRSRWPEPDTVRRMTQRSAPLHPPQHLVSEAAPRAQFGMPIILHFKDQGDPGDSMISPDGRDRYASPLILRPFGTRANSRPMALLMGNRPDLQLVMKSDQKTGQPKARLTPQQVDQLHESLRPHFRDAGGDAALAFMNFFQTQVSK